jgi:cell division septum initiation protein DivIVA
MADNKFRSWVGFKEETVAVPTENAVERIRQLETQLADLRSRRDITSLSKEEFEILAGETAMSLIKTAQQRESRATSQAEQMVAEATRITKERLESSENKAKAILAGAESRGRKYLSAAESEAEELREKATRSAEHLLTESRREANALSSAAKREAEKIISEATVVFEQSPQSQQPDGNCGSIIIRYHPEKKCCRIEECIFIHRRIPCKFKMGKFMPDIPNDIRQENN